jgi:hypothetical protein
MKLLCGAENGMNWFPLMQNAPCSKATYGFREQAFSGNSDRPLSCNFCQYSHYKHWKVGKLHADGTVKELSLRSPRKQFTGDRRHSSKTDSKLYRSVTTRAYGVRKWSLYVPPALTYQYSAFCHTVYLCVPYGSHNKQRLFPQTALTGWAL